jgi:hypothetical protein
MATAAEVEALRQRLLWDTPFWASHCAWIVNKQRQPQKLVPLPWQARTPESRVTPLDEALEAQRAAGMPMRAIILKARKLGFSTWAQAKAMQRVTQQPHQSALTVAHKGDASAELFDMGYRMWESLPSDPMLAELIYGAGTGRDAPFSVKPQKLSEGLARNGTRHLELGDKRRRTESSSYRTLTAGSKGGGRASTPNIIHASEYGHWEDPDYGVGLFNAMPLERETIGIVESTAKGFNHFWEMWKRATAGAEDEDIGGVWVPLFYGWQDNPGNALRFASDRVRDRFERTIGDEDGGGDAEEIELVEAYGVTLEQLNWRRNTINGPEANGSVEWFHQEHPATPEQAFIGSGNPVFPGILVARAIKEAQDAPAPVEGVLRGAEWREHRTRSGSIRVPESALWISREFLEPEDLDRWGSTHLLRVWGHPVNSVTQSGLALADRRPDGQYVVFVDTAVGSDGSADGGDYHAVQVIDHITRAQVASYRSRIPLHDLPLLVYLVGLYWNRAWVAVEVNSYGKGVVDMLQKDYRYPLMYKTHRGGTDARTDVAGYKVGWETTLASKPLMETTFGTALREGWHGLRCLQTAREFSTYVQDPKRPEKHGAQKGAHDDLAISYMGVQQVAAELQPRRARSKGEPRWRPADDVTAY